MGSVMFFSTGRNYLYILLYSLSVFLIQDTSKTQIQKKQVVETFTIIFGSSTSIIVPMFCPILNKPRKLLVPLTFSMTLSVGCWIGLLPVKPPVEIYFYIQIEQSGDKFFWNLTLPNCLSLGLHHKLWKYIKLMLRQIVM